METQARKDLIEKIKKMQAIYDSASTPDTMKAMIKTGLEGANKALEALDAAEKELVNAEEEKKKADKQATIARAQAAMKTKAAKTPAAKEKIQKALSPAIEKAKKAMGETKKAKEKIIPAKKAAEKAAKSLKTIIAAKPELKKLYGGETETQLIRDAGRRAMNPGKRTSASGKTYYEKRPNRVDLTHKKYPLLEKGGPIATPTEIEIDWDQFREKYKPIQNKLTNREEYNGWLFETYGEDEAYIRDYAQKHPNNVWTIMDVGYIMIGSGWHFVDRFGYIITEVAFKDGESISVIDPEDREQAENEEEDDFKNGGKVKNKKITYLDISKENPLSSQLQKLTGSIWNQLDFKSVDPKQALSTMNPFRHIKTGKVFAVNPPKFKAGGTTGGTMAELKRKLQIGQAIKLVNFFGQTDPNDANDRAKGRLQKVRFVVKVQTNGVYFSPNKTDKSGSYWEFPPASLIEVTEKGFKVYGPGARELNAEEKKIMANEPKDTKQDEIDMMSDGSTMYYRRKGYYEREHPQYAYLFIPGWQNKLRFDSNQQKVYDKDVKGQVELEYEFVNDGEFKAGGPVAETMWLSVNESEPFTYEEFYAENNEDPDVDPLTEDQLDAIKALAIGESWSTGGTADVEIKRISAPMEMGGELTYKDGTPVHYAVHCSDGRCHIVHRKNGRALPTNIVFRWTYGNHNRFTSPEAAETALKKMLINLHEENPEHNPEPAFYKPHRKKIFGLFEDGGILKEITEEKIEEAINEDYFNEAIIIIQDAIGQDDGGVASIHFSGYDRDDEGNIKEWEDKSKRRKIITDYLETEDTYAALRDDRDRGPGNSSMSYHNEVRDWIKNNAPAEYQNVSLDEIPLSVFNDKQMVEYNELIDRFFGNNNYEAGGVFENAESITKQQFLDKVKAALRETNKWHFLIYIVDGKSVYLKLFPGVKEVDVQRFNIGNIAASMPRNYVGKKETYSMIEAAINNNFESGGNVSTDITEDLKNFDLDSLDPLEEMMYEDLIKNSSKEQALQILINNVEGDYSQLSEELAELAEKQNPEESYGKGGQVKDEWVKSGDTYNNSKTGYSIIELTNDRYQVLDQEGFDAVGESFSSLKRAKAVADQTASDAQYKKGGEIKTEEDFYNSAVAYLKSAYLLEPNDLFPANVHDDMADSLKSGETPQEYVDELANKYDLDKVSSGYGYEKGGTVTEYSVKDIEKRVPTFTKQYQVLLKKDNNTEEIVLIFADSENTARWEGKKKDGVYEAVVLRLNTPGSKYYISEKGAGGITEPGIKEMKNRILAFTKQFPLNATNWGQATNELPDLHDSLANEYNEREPAVKYKFDFSKASKTPAECNKRNRAGIEKLLTLSDDDCISTIYYMYENWFDPSCEKYEKGGELKYKDGRSVQQVFSVSGSAGSWHINNVGINGEREMNTDSVNYWTGNENNDFKTKEAATDALKVMLRKMHKENPGYNPAFAKGGRVSGEHWFKKAVEDQPPYDLQGWKKDQTAEVRRRHAIDSRPSDMNQHQKLASAGRALQALANVTKDKETNKIAREDAAYFFAAARQGAKKAINPAIEKAKQAMGKSKTQKKEKGGPIEGNFKPGIFTLDDDHFYKGYSLPEEEWNGWAVPYFEKDEALKFLEDTDKPIKWEMKDGINTLFANLDPDDPDYDYDEMGPIKIVVNGKEIETYTPGGYSWIWSEVTIPKGEKLFSWKDKSGGGRKNNKMPLDQILNIENDRNWDGMDLWLWAISCEEGDEWENAANKFECTKDKTERD